MNDGSLEIDNKHCEQEKSSHYRDALSPFPHERAAIAASHL